MARLTHGITLAVFLIGVSLASPGCDSGESEADINAFLDNHWSRPLRPQGEPPATFPVAETRLDAGSCGVCHPDQIRDWSGSFHSRAMSPGLLGQLMDMAADDREGHQACLRCHAPLAEQAEELVSHLTAAFSPFPESSSATGPQLFRQGILCAACHVRDFHFYGPPRREELAPWPAGERIPHDGWTTTSAYQNSRFCAACHQFDPEQGRLAGKLLEDTYGQWAASRYAAEGKTCQSCHMPDRRHLWRGIHDSAMVRDGVTIETTAPTLRGDTLLGTLAVTNTNVGHKFPTYVTPRIILEGMQLDAEGNTLPESRQWRWISWEASVNLEEEYQDTRLDPDQMLSLDYAAPLDPRSVEILLRVRVEPDAFYTMFYEALLDGGFTTRGRKLIEQALRESRESEFVLFESLLRIPQPGS